MTGIVRGVLFLTMVSAAPGPDPPDGPPLHARVDALIEAAVKGRAVSPPVDDAGFLRRLSLDLTGSVPTAREARAFLDDPAPDKRARLVDRLLDGPGYPRRMQEFVNVMFMERLGDHAGWAEYLLASFAANKTWDRLAREILRGAPDDPSARAAAFFYSKRLEHYGENPVDYPALTRDVGRLFLGIDLRCAQCHDHLFIDDYTQNDFQGLHAFFQNVSLGDPKAPSVVEKPTTQKLSYSSVFKKVPKETGPRVPGMPEIALPALAKGKEYVTPPDPKTKSPGTLRFSLLGALADQLPTDKNPAFARNVVNRLWFLMMGRGLVHPLDQAHADNPPSHPELLDLLAAEFVRHGYDGKWLLRELALTAAYQRSDLLPPGGDEPPPESYRTALEKRLSAETMLRSLLVATGPDDPAALEKDVTSGFESLRGKFLKAFANEPRDPEEEPNPSLRAALFLQNDAAILKRLEPRPNHLIDRLSRLSDPGAVAEELYLSVLTRRPTREESAEVAEELARNADRRAAALGRLAWALLASAEFGVNH